VGCLFHARGLVSQTGGGRVVSSSLSSRALACYHRQAGPTFQSHLPAPDRDELQQTRWIRAVRWGEKRPRSAKFVGRCNRPGSMPLGRTPTRGINHCRGRHVGDVRGGQRERENVRCRCGRFELMAMAGLRNWTHGPHHAARNTAVAYRGRSSWNRLPWIRRRRGSACFRGQLCRSSFSVSSRPQDVPCPLLCVFLASGGRIRYLGIESTARRWNSAVGRSWRRLRPAREGGR
jgi:hypothetical protein